MSTVTIFNIEQLLFSRQYEDAAKMLNEMIVDLRRIHTIRLDLLMTLCSAGKRRARLQIPYREHLAKHFADTFSRIGLPQPYETL